jgi:hypothetical protein
LFFSNLIVYERILSCLKIISPLSFVSFIRFYLLYQAVS